MQEWLTGQCFGIPVPFWIMVLVATASGVLLHATVYGRHLYAVGHNEEAARHSGIHTEWVVTTAYLICGLTAALSSILFAIDSGGITPTATTVIFMNYTASLRPWSQVAVCAAAKDP